MTAIQYGVIGNWESEWPDVCCPECGGDAAVGHASIEDVVEEIPVMNVRTVARITRPTGYFEQTLTGMCLAHQHEFRIASRFLPLPTIKVAGTNETVLTWAGDA